MALDITVIQSSFEMLKPIATEAISHFYDTLFLTYPESKNLFRSVDIEKQKSALLSSLVRIVEGLDDLDKLKRYLRPLGSRHVAYGIKEEHYSMIGKSLLLTFRHFFKEKWNSDLEDQWILVIGFIADQMMEGAKERQNNSELNIVTHDNSQLVQSKSGRPEIQDLSHYVRRIARDILLKALESELDTEFMKTAKKKASGILSQAIRDEAEQLHTSLSSPNMKKVSSLET